MLGSDAVPEYAGKPQGDADFNGAKYYVVSIATGKVNSAKYEGGKKLKFASLCFAHFVALLGFPKLFQGFGKQKPSGDH